MAARWCAGTRGGFKCTDGVGEGERRQRRGARWQDHEEEVRGADTVHVREKLARQEVQGSEAAKERERWGPREVRGRSEWPTWHV